MISSLATTIAIRGEIANSVLFMHILHTRFEDAKGRVTSLIHSSIVAGESNSLLVIGPRGSGKSFLIKGKKKACHNRFRSQISSAGVQNH